MSRISDIKHRIDARTYYQNEGVHIGKHTGRGWHQTSNLCPFHSDKKAGTFHINIHTGRFTCFSCGSQGDVIDFHAHKHGMSIGEALKDLGGKY